MPTSNTFMPVSHIESLSEISETYFWWKGRFDWVAEVLKKAQTHSKIENYIDVGCGSGQFAQKLDSVFNFKRVGLIDGEAALLNKVKNFTKAEVSLQNLTQALEFPFAPELVTMMDVLEHLPDDRAFLRNLYLKMPRKSYLLITVPALPFAFSEWDKQLGHYRRYYKNDLQNKVKEAGFKILRSEYAWSFLVPSAISRRFKKKRYEQNMEFEKIPSIVNSMLLGASFLERKVAQLISPPWGTSVYLIGVK